MAGAADAVAAAAYRAGFRGEALVTAVAIAGAESGFRYNAIGDHGDSVGPWQINMPSHPEYSRDALLNMDNNARAAFKISGGGTNFKPWTTYRTGAYRGMLSTARTAVGNAAKDPSYDPTPRPGAADVPIVGPVVTGLDALVKLAEALLNPREWLIRVLEVVGGLVLAAAGALLISKDLVPVAGKVPGAVKLAAAVA